MTTTSSSRIVGHRPDGCILLFGMPRSGTTWLGKLFDSHPDTLYRHEPDTSQRLVMPRYPGIEESDRYLETVRTFVEELPQVNTLRVAGKLPLFPKAYLPGLRAQLLHGNVWLARLGSQLNLEIPVRACGGRRQRVQPRVVWKSIESMGRFGLILKALPEARGVHIMRHPCGYVASVLRGQRAKYFTDNTSASEDFGIFNYAMNSALGDAYQLSLDNLKSLAPEERLAWGWVLINEKAMRESEYTGRTLCVRYEDICLDPLSRTEQMFAFAGLAMTEQTRRFVAASTSRSSDRYYSVYKNPESAAMRWLEELSPEIITRVMAIVQRSRFADYFAADSIEAPVTP